jgi:hypothetical protein
MKIIYKGYFGKPLAPRSEWHWEVSEAVDRALSLIEGRHGFRTPSEIWRDCELHITIGHNIYTTSIHIRPPEMAKINRRANWHNGFAYYCNGAFWANISKTKVELI